MCVFTDILKSEYPAAYGTTWKADYTVKAVMTSEPEFEIADKKESIIQPAGQGVARFLNPNRKEIEVLDFEAFVDQFTQSVKAEQGKKCDFILTDSRGEDVIVFNEISCLSSKSLQAFPQTEATDRGKIEKSFNQLRCSIERVRKSAKLAEHIDGYRVKVGLFSYRLTDAVKENAATRAMQDFNAPLMAQPVVRIKDALPGGFAYQRRAYPEGYEV